jgi:hypothetical protein
MKYITKIKVSIVTATLMVIILIGSTYQRNPNTPIDIMIVIAIFYWGIIFALVYFLGKWIGID